jgi:invasion protein IalB
MAWRCVRMLRRLTARGRAAYVRFVAIGALAFLAVVSEASAQINMSPSQVLLSSWIKSCTTRSDPHSTPICETSKDVYEGGRLVASVAVIETDSVPRRFFRLTTVPGIELQNGARLSFDWDQPFIAPHFGCAPAAERARGCTAHYEATPEFIERLKSAQLLTARAIDKNGEPIKIQIDLKEFASVYEGPPADLEALGEQQMELPGKSPGLIRDDTLQRRLRPGN